MNYSINRIKSVTKSYLDRHIFTSRLNKCILIDLTNSFIDRITNNTKTEDIISILANEFTNDINKIYFTALEYKNMKDDFILYFYKDKPVYFKDINYYWYIYEGKLFADKLENIPDDAITFPIRTMKKIHGRIIKAINIDKSNPLYNGIYKRTIVFIDEYNNVIEFPQSRFYLCSKILLIGEKYQLFLRCNANYNNEDFVREINQYLIDNPCYIVLLDSGRYSGVQISDNIEKEKYVQSGFNDYDDMFVFGEVVK